MISADLSALCDVLVYKWSLSLIIELIITLLHVPILHFGYRIYYVLSLIDLIVFNFQLIARPDACLVAFTSDEFNIYVLMDKLDSRGCVFITLLLE
jgi:hypothetical protein